MLAIESQNTVRDLSYSLHNTYTMKQGTDMARVKMVVYCHELVIMVCTSISEGTLQKRLYALASEKR